MSLSIYVATVVLYDVEKTFCISSSGTSAKSPADALENAMSLHDMDISSLARALVKSAPSYIDADKLIGFAFHEGTEPMPAIQALSTAGVNVSIFESVVD